MRVANPLRKNLREEGSVAEAKKKANGQPPAKRVKLLSDDSDEELSTAEAEDRSFKINEEYVKRFEHNKKREELHRREFSGLCFRGCPLITFEVEEKYGKSSVAHKLKSDDTGNEDGNTSNSEESSDSEEDDDEGVLVTETLDAEISATLQAIRTKDPRVYDKQSRFYTEPREAEGDGVVASKAEKPMFLKDYHRKNYLEGHLGQEEDEEDIPRTYAQEQDDLKRAIAREIHAAAGGEEGVDDDDDHGDGGFLFSSQKPKADGNETTANRKAKGITEIDVAIADKDPELFLSNFMSSRAWVPVASSQFQPFESDDDEEDRQAEEFEHAYNLRFEDPEGSNEKLRTHSRTAAAKYSFRREEV